MANNLHQKELEKLLGISLILMTHLEAISIYTNQNSIVVNEDENIIGLNLAGQQIQDTSFLAILPDIQWLNLTNNQISHLSNFSKLQKITHLYLVGNYITDINVLADLAQLEVLKITQNEVQDISALTYLTNLTELDLGVNTIYDCSPLGKLKKLEKLHLGSNGISQINFLSELKNLSLLNLEDNDIKDISPLAQLVNLNHLSLRENSISELGALKRLIRLKYLDLSQNYKITETEALNNLPQLKYLNLGINKIKEIDFLVNCKFLEYLNLESNQIENLYPLHGLELLEKLIIGSNEIYETYPLQFLVNLRELSIASNPISDLSFLLNLNYLNILSIGGSHISDYSGIINLLQLNSLHIMECGLSDISFLKGLKELTKLNLSSNLITDASPIASLRNLTNLDLNSNLISDISFLESLPKLNKLSLWRNKIIAINAIKNLSNLKELDLRNNEITQIDLLSDMPNLEVLDLRGNQIENINIIENLPKIRYLQASSNQIFKITLKKTLKSLSFLSVANNNLSNTDFLAKTPNISTIDLSSNTITELKGIENLKYLNRILLGNNLIYDAHQFDFILQYQELEINVSNNPFFNNAHIILKEKENHFQIIANELKKLEDQQIKAILPEKIVLLGNHASGKSSFVHYLQNKNLNHKEDSTHILKIENYPNKFDKLPKAIIYDFGGQDFYHGIYKAFLTSDAVTLLLWQTSTNSCHFQVDSHNRPNRNFDVDYWIGQKRHSNISGETILIQTHADETDISTRKSYINKYAEIEDEFFISLSSRTIQYSASKLNISALRYLKDRIDYTINIKQTYKNKSGKISKPYFKFLQNILTSEKDHKCTTKEKLRQLYLVEEKWRYDQDLEQLHRQGLILVHRENVWLSPVELTKYVHTEILKKEYLNNGIIEKSVFENKSLHPEIIDLLISQKVIFLHHFGYQNNKRQEEYIIPNYLPLINHSGADLSLMTFGLDTPLFVLKFKRYLPFGIINQLICYFGQLPDQKKFWRDFLIFTIDRQAKIMINLDLDNLQIKVFAEFKKTTSTDFQNNVEKYLFYSIMAMYWDFKALPENLDSFIKNYTKANMTTINEGENWDLDYSEDLLRSFYHDHNCRPKDLYISKDGINFLKYKALCEVDAYQNRLMNFKTNKKGEFKTHKELPFHMYQNFTNRNLRTMKKIFISYSRKDKKFKDDLKTHLKILERYCVAKAWSCEEMKAGEWDSQIQDELAESDIIIYMVSDNFLASDYIMEKEVNIGIDYVKDNPSKKIICVLVRECAWDSWQFLADNFKADGATNQSTTLGKYQFIPWHIFNAKEDNEREELIALEQWNRNGYEVRSLAYKQICNKVLDAIKQIS